MLHCEENRLAVEWYRARSLSCCAKYSLRAADNAVKNRSSSGAAGGADNTGLVTLPRLPLSVAFRSNSSSSDFGGGGTADRRPPAAQTKSRFTALLEKHGYVILTGVSEGAALYRCLEAALMGGRVAGEDQAVPRAAHGAGTTHGAAAGAAAASPAAAAGFFLQSPAGSIAKRACVGEVYESERGVPMWHCGYEYVEDKVREAFRVHAAAAAAAEEEEEQERQAQGGGSIGAGDQDVLRWPSVDIRARWVQLLRFCHSLTDAALAVVLSDAAAGGEDTSGKRAASSSSTVTRPDEVAEMRRRALRIGEDFSVAYALHYPNEEGGAPALPPALAGGEERINVKEHVDPSLLVVEPVADVPGLDVWDTHLGQWVSVEEACCDSPALAWVIFGGRCLEKATGSRVRACLHRVSRSAIDKRRRFCFIFEQKIGDFYDDP